MEYYEAYQAERKTVSKGKSGLHTIQQIYEQDHTTAENFSKYKSFKNISDKLEIDNKVFIFFGKGTHKIKKKAEQIACEIAIKSILNKS